jgi:hypothetical protein
MSRKYQQYLEALKRDREPCAACGHPRVWHIGDRACAAGSLKPPCECKRFVAKAA